MGYDYDRSKKAADSSSDPIGWKVAAPRRKKPPELMRTRQKPTLEKIVADELQRAVALAISKATNRDGFATKLKEFKPGNQDDSFSDGTLPSRGYDSLGYSFTVSFPSRLYGSGTVELDLSDEWRRGAAIEARGEELEFTEDEIEQAGKNVDLVQLVRSELNGIDALPSLEDLPETQRIAAEDAIEEKCDTSIAAYSEEENDVELAEYPAVYLRWRGSLKKFDSAVSQSGSKIIVKFKAEWVVRPHRWAYDSDARSSDWHYIG